MADRGVIRWRPDTCSCVIEYYGDDLSFHVTVESCLKHADVHGTPEHLAAIRAHNTKKNEVLNEIISSFGIDPEKEPIPFVGYDPNAPKSNDRLKVRGVGLVASAIADKGKAMRLSDVRTRLSKFSGVDVED